MLITNIRQVVDLSQESITNPFQSPHTIRIGPAGWSYKDWEGTVYPPHGSRFDPLSYLAHYFDTIEVNSSFYRVPPTSHALSWRRRVESNRDFRFTVKLFRGFTHEKTEPAGQDVSGFRSFLDPLVEDQRLGALLIQFPWSFKFDAEARDRLSGIFDRFAPYPKVVEVRHGSFQQLDFYSFLEDHGVGFTNIDQPVFGDSVRPSEVVTGGVGYVRFHGRNYEKWFAHQESWERYNYLYESSELSPWLPRIRSMAEKSDVYVVTNNHFRGQAIVNALELKSALGQPVEVPPQIRQSYSDRFQLKPV